MRSRQEYYNRGSKFTKEELRERQRIAQLKYCQSAYGIQKRKEYREKNIEKILLKNKEYREKNKDLIKIRARISKTKYKASAKGTETQRRYYEKNEKKIKIYQKYITLLISLIQII